MDSKKVESARVETKDEAKKAPVTPTVEKKKLSDRVSKYGHYDKLQG
jgi:hypothetical protein